MRSSLTAHTFHLALAVAGTMLCVAAAAWAVWRGRRRRATGASGFGWVRNGVVAVASAIGAVCVGSGVGAYGELEVQRALEALPCVETARLAGYLSHPDSRVRGLAAHRYFERRADDDMVRTLVRLLCDPVQSVRGAAATGLSTQTLPDDTLRDVEAAIRAESQSRMALLSALQRRALVAVPHLARLAASADPDVRDGAAYRLRDVCAGRFGDEITTYQRALAGLLGSDDPAERRLVVRLFASGPFAGQEIRPALVRGLGDADPDVAWLAGVALLRVWPDPTVERAARATLLNLRDRVRADAQRAEPWHRELHQEVARFIDIRASGG